MSQVREEAPIFVRAYDLHSWLLDRFEERGRHPEARTAVLTSSRLLLENVSLALAGHTPHARAAEADEDIVLLRLHLRLAAEKGLIDPRQLLHANEQLRDVGRQLGGWRKRLEAVG